MEHHICKGTCGHVSDKPGMCGTEDCTQRGQPFEQCDCGDASAHVSEKGTTESDESPVA